MGTSQITVNGVRLEVDGAWDKKRIRRLERNVLLAQETRAMATTPKRDDTPDAPTRTDVDALAASLSRHLGIRQTDLARMLVTYGRKAPPGEFADAVQTIAAEWLYEKPSNAKLANVIARTTVTDYWRRWRTRQHYGIESSLDTQTVMHGLQESLVAGVEWELNVADELDGAAVWRTLPARIRDIAQQRLDGQKLETADRKFLSRWLKTDGAASLHRLLISP